VPLFSYFLVFSFSDFNTKWLNSNFNFLKKYKMKNSKRKIDKMAAISVAAEFCAIFALIFVVSLLVIANTLGGARAGLAQASLPLQNNCSCQSGVDTCSVSTLPVVLFPVSADNPAEGSIKILMDDGGFNPKTLDVASSSNLVAEITNKGVNPHSFVIDDLGIDSGAIQPGQTKAVALENLGAGKGTYIYYSNIDGDHHDVFSGTMTAK
jgi:hypothetical protein